MGKTKGVLTQNTFSCGCEWYAGQNFCYFMVVHHWEEVFGETVQKVEIYYKIIGFVEFLSMSNSEKEKHIKCFSRKKESRIA